MGKRRFFDDFVDAGGENESKILHDYQRGLQTKEPR